MVITILALLMSLLLPVISRANEQAQKLVCANQIRQISLVTMVYAGDEGDLFPTNWYGSATSIPPNAPRKSSYLGRGLAMRPYLNGSNEVFICPSDLHHTRSESWFYNHSNSAGWLGPGHGRFGDPRMSYTYNRLLLGIQIPWAPLPLPNRGAITVDSMVSPSVCYMWLDATMDWSGIQWHDPPYETFGSYCWESVHDGEDNVAFVDGHIKSINTRDVLPPRYYGPLEYQGFTSDPEYPLNRRPPDSISYLVGFSAECVRSVASLQSLKSPRSREGASPS